MIDQQPVEERLVAVLQRGETDVLLEIVTLAAEMLQLEGDLLLDCHGSPRQQAAKSECRSLVLGESSVLVDRRGSRATQDPAPTQPQPGGHLDQTDPPQHHVLPSLSRVQITRSFLEL